MATRERPTGSFRPVAAVRDAVVDSAVEVMGRRGVYQARLEDVAQAAGAGLEGVRAHFKDKDDLLATVVDELVGRLAELTPERELAGLELALRVRRVVQEHLAHFQQHPGQLLVLHQARGITLQEPERFPAVGVALQLYPVLLGRLLRQPGQPESPAQRRAAVVLASIILGAAVGRVDRRDDTLIAAAARAYSAILQEP
ncbi:MAG: TetR/AcrR family transcriptional regulator [Myxococcota bacterium]